MPSAPVSTEQAREVGDVVYPHRTDIDLDAHIRKLRHRAAAAPTSARWLCHNGWPGGISRLPHVFADAVPSRPRTGVGRR
jgi:hypothetical protein